MSERIEPPSVATIGELFQKRKHAQNEQKLAEVAILGMLSRYQEHQTPVRVVGFPSRVAVAHHDDDGVVTSRTSVHIGPLAPNKEGHRREPRSIDQSYIADIRKEVHGLIVSVEPIGTDTWWQFGLDSIVEIEAIEQDDTPARLKTQRAILNSEAFWGTRSGDPSRQFDFEP